MKDSEISSPSLPGSDRYAMPSECPALSSSGSVLASDQSCYRIVTMTPAQARSLLDRPRPHAKRQDRTVRAYSSSMRADRWVLNGMPIIISNRGILLDGLQRLHACVDVNRSFETFLADQIDHNADHTIDQQRRRSFAGVLQARNVPQAHALQGALIKLMRIDSGTINEPASQLPSWTAMDRVLAANPWLHDAVRASLAIPGCLLPEPIRSTVVCMGYRVDRAGTDRFLDTLMRPEHYPISEPGVLLLHEIQRGLDRPTEHRSMTYLLSLAIKSLDATLNGVPIRRLGWSGPGANVRELEAFPKLTSYPGLSAFNPTMPNEPGLPSNGLGLAVSSGDPNAIKPVFAVETIDPDRAARYLTRNTGNRRISQAHVDEIARDLQENRWIYNAQPICFADNGRLMNGQHRLHAVIAANREINAPVVYGLNEAAYPTYDNHARRRTKVGNERADFGDLGLAHAMANLLWRKERKARETINATASVAEIHQIIKEHPRLLTLRGFARKMGHFGRASVIGYGAYVIERDNPRLAQRFLESFETGANLGPGHPILALRSVMQKLRNDKASQAEQLAALLAGWERFKERAARNSRSI